MVSVITATLANSTCENFAKIHNTRWKDISHNQKFHSIATNTQTPIIWASLKTNHASGEGSQIAHFDTKTWKKDLT